MTITDQKRLDIMLHQVLTEIVFEQKQGDADMDHKIGLIEDLKRRVIIPFMVKIRDASYFDELARQNNTYYQWEELRKEK